MHTIGILLPRSTFYDTMSYDLFQGLKAGIRSMGNDNIRITTENIGFGADKQQCYRGAEKLLLEENASVVIAYIGHRTAQLLRPLFLAANRLLIVLDAGASLPQEWPSCPSIFYLSLQNALGAWLAGTMAVEEGHLAGGMVTGYYDGGYLHTYSISKSFEQAGGTIRFNHATGYTDDDFSMKPLTAHLEENPESALLSLFSGDFLQWYFREVKENLIPNTAPIYLSPFGMDENVLEVSDFPNNKVRGIAAWSKTIKTQPNQNFCVAMEEASRTPNLFSLLGWESAIVASTALSLADSTKNNISEMAEALHDFTFESPRGTISFDPKTNTSIAPLYKASVASSLQGKCILQIEEMVSNTKESFQSMAGEDLNGAYSSWYNSYTCI